MPSYLALHTALLIWAATALFAKLIPLPAAEIIQLRSAPALVALCITMIFFRQGFGLSGRNLWIAPLLGLLMAGHWVCFYLSVQTATVAVGLITLYSYPALTVLLEPLIHRHWPSWKLVVLALLGLGGISLIALVDQPVEDLPLAIGYGLFSSVCFTCRNLVSKYLASELSSIQQMWWQVLITLLLLSLWLGAPDTQSLNQEILFLLCLLGVVFVALPHTLFLFSLKQIPAARASLISMIQPVYGVLFAWFILAEQPHWVQIFGGIIVLTSAWLATREGLVHETNR